MNVLENVHSYVERRRANGVAFDKGHKNLTAFAKQLGSVPIHAITTYDIVKFLDGPFTSTVTWRGKHSLLRHFFEFWAARGYASVPLMPPPERRCVRLLFPTFTHEQKFGRSLKPREFFRVEMLGIWKLTP